MCKKGHRNCMISNVTQLPCTVQIICLLARRLSVLSCGPIGKQMYRISGSSILPKFATRGTTCTNCWLFYDVDSSKLYQILSHAFTHSKIYRSADQSEGNILQAILQVVPWWRIMALKLAIAINIASIHLGAQLQIEL